MALHEPKPKNIHGKKKKARNFEPTIECIMCKNRGTSRHVGF